MAGRSSIDVNELEVILVRFAFALVRLVFDKLVIVADVKFAFDRDNVPVERFVATKFPIVLTAEFKVPVLIFDVARSVAVVRPDDKFNEVDETLVINALVEVNPV